MRGSSPILAILLDRRPEPLNRGPALVQATAHAAGVEDNLHWVGLLTAAYATGGVTDAAGDGVSGKLITPGDVAGFARAVLALLAEPLPAQNTRSLAQRFAWSQGG